MSKGTKLTMTLPDALVTALEAMGSPLGMNGQEWLKHQVIAAMTQPAGVLLKIEPVKLDKAQGHPELPLEMKGGPDNGL